MRTLMLFGGYGSVDAHWEWALAGENAGMVGLRIPAAPVALGLAAAFATACAGADSSPAESGTVASEARVSVDDRVFVLSETDRLSLLDAESAPSVDISAITPLQTYALVGSPHNDADGRRVSFGIVDATGQPLDEIVSQGNEIAVGDRSFHWVSEGEGQRTYVGPTFEGATIAMSTLNVDEPSAVALLTAAEVSGDDVLFDGRVVPDGWVDTGTSTTLLRFVAGSTGSATPPGGRRILYGDPSSVAEPSWDNIANGFGVTLATWPVTGTDPENEARHNLDGEIEVQVMRADGATSVGYATPPGDEFYESLVWRDGTTWLALSRPRSENGEPLVELAALVREATTEEAARLDSLAAD